MEHIGYSSEGECYEWELYVAYKYYMVITIGRQFIVMYEKFKCLVFLIACAMFILTTLD